MESSHRHSRRSFAFVPVRNPSPIRRLLPSSPLYHLPSHLKPRSRPRFDALHLHPASTSIFPSTTVFGRSEQRGAAMARFGRRWLRVGWRALREVRRRRQSLFLRLPLERRCWDYSHRRRRRSRWSGADRKRVRVRPRQQHHRQRPPSSSSTSQVS
ncbi:hypothetical protein BCR35DRAFT_125820 [Leucosporidium creatinivorum]|uniref:Uncharacterized protein n=1 Tax=Leucosporidium creatinivorum TaxID=106004 RepID=A0A1Y2EVN6_9BASI|nr:hypothetical protein BCR35DRAFT_125820 [Leucosporidium creatinivorum]